MSNIGYIHPAPHAQLTTSGERTQLPRLRGSIWATARAVASASSAVMVSLAVMAGLVALRLWFLMPASFYFPS